MEKSKRESRASWWNRTLGNVVTLLVIAVVIFILLAVVLR